MGEVIKPSMDSRILKIVSNTSKLDRIRYRASQKTAQERLLTLLKTAPLPLVQPAFTRVKDSKCGKCNVECKTYTKLDDWYMEPVDALTMKIFAKEYESGWFNKMKLCVFSLRKILAASMTSLVIHPAHIKMMKNLQKNNPEVPLVFVLDSENPQLDILLLSYVLYVNDINLPLTAVNKQLESELFVGRILKQMNVKFSEKDGKIGDTQVESQLKANGNILVMLDDDIDEKGLQTVLTSSAEVFFLPVTINSEKICKDFKLKLFNNHNLGIVKINFHEPYTIKDLLRASETSDLFPQQTADKVTTIKKHLQYDVSIKRSVMSTNVVAFLLTTKFRVGASVSDLAGELDAMRKKNPSIDYGFEGKAEDIVQHAIHILGDSLIETKGDFNKPRNSEMVSLSKYAEVLFPHFALQSILIISAQSLKQSETFVDFNNLLTLAAELCELLQFQIKCTKPCEDLFSQLSNAFELCSLEGIMNKPVVEPLTCNEVRAQRIARQFENEGSPSDDDDDGYQSRNANNEVTINEEMSEQIDALKNVTVPIIDAYLTVACCLKEFVGLKFTEQEFIRKSVKMMREDLEDGNCKYWESCSEEWVKNALKCLERSAMIEIDRTGEDNIINIHSDFNNSKSIKFLIRKINRFL